MLKNFLPLFWGKEWELFKVRLFYRKNDVYIGSYDVQKGAQLGKHVRILHDVQIRQNVSIGDYTYVEPFSSVISANIGKFCSIGKCCQIGPWKHPLESMTTSPEVLRRIVRKPELYNDLPPRAEIGNDVWIGSNSIIMGGVKIGNGAVIGAGTVVTKDIPDYAIVVGVPARIIRYRFDEKMIEKLNRVRWWDWSYKKLLDNECLFTQIHDWKKEIEENGLQ